MRVARSCSIAALVVLAMASTVVLAQDGAPAPRRQPTNAAPKPTGPTPRTPDGHPDLTGVWNGKGDSLTGVPNQTENSGVLIDDEYSAHDIATGTRIAAFPRPVGSRFGTVAISGNEGERAATLLRRIGSNRPIYKPEYWDEVRRLDDNANEEDPSNQCMPAGIPRAGIPQYIAQLPDRFVFIYPGQGGLIATQTMYRMIPADGRRHTPLQKLDGTYLGEPIARWDGDTLVVDSWGFNTNTWFDQVGGYFHSENMHTIERFHREGNTLTWTVTVEDPDVLLQPWTSTPRVAVLNRDPHAMLLEGYPCHERDLGNSVTKEHH